MSNKVCKCTLLPFTRSVALFSIIVISLSAHAQRYWAPYSEFYELYDKFNSIPKEKRDLVDLKLMAEIVGDMPIEDVRFTYDLEGVLFDFGVSSANEFLFPLDPELIKINPKINTNLPAGQKVLFTLSAAYVDAGGPTVRAEG